MRTALITLFIFFSSISYGQSYWYGSIGGGTVGTHDNLRLSFNALFSEKHTISAVYYYNTGEYKNPPTDYIKGETLFGESAEPYEYMWSISALYGWSKDLTGGLFRFTMKAGPVIRSAYRALKIYTQYGSFSWVVFSILMKATMISSIIQ